MTLPTIKEARSWRGLMLVANGDEPVGRIDAVYVDRTTRQPEWVLVHTGLFGSSRTFVPLTDATKLGDTVRVPHDPGVVREAPRLEPDVDLSESDEARLYAHYGIDYTTAVSPSGLPATESGTDATTELPQPSAAVPSTAASRLEADAVAWPERAGGRRRPLLAGLGALALAAVGSGLALLRARRRRPASFGDRLAKAGRDAADTLTSTAGSIIREAAAAGGSDRARQAASGGRRAARRATRRAAARAAAGGAAAAAGGRRAARRAGGAGREAGRQAASGGRRFARRAGREAAEAAAGTKATVAAAGSRAAETRATVASKRGGRRRARKRAAAAAAGTARSLTGFPTAAGRRMQRLDLDQRGRKVREQARQAVPRRRRRSKMKVIGKLGMALGAAVGYVLGAKAGRERYEQIAASARQLMEKPQVKRVMESAPGNLGARVEQVANKAADAVHQASDRVAPSDTGTGATAEPAPVPSATGSSAETGAPRGAGNANRRSSGGSGSRERSKSD
jgi:PRC-barrel domain protein